MGFEPTRLTQFNLYGLYHLGYTGEAKLVLNRSAWLPIEDEERLKKAGDEDRTRVIALEGRGSTIELLPRGVKHGIWYDRWRRLPPNVISQKKRGMAGGEKRNPR